MAPRNAQTSVRLNVYDLSPANDYISGALFCVCAIGAILGDGAVRLLDALSLLRSLEVDDADVGRVSVLVTGPSARRGLVPQRHRDRWRRVLVRERRRDLYDNTERGSRCVWSEKKVRSSGHSTAWLTIDLSPCLVRRRLPRVDRARRFPGLVHGRQTARAVAATRVRGRQLQPAHKVRERTGVDVEHRATLRFEPGPTD